MKSSSPSSAGSRSLAPKSTIVPSGTDRVDGALERASSYAVEDDVERGRLELAARDHAIGAHVDELARARGVAHLRCHPAAGTGGELDGQVARPAGGSKDEHTATEQRPGEPNRAQRRATREAERRSVLERDGAIELRQRQPVPLR